MNTEVNSICDKCLCDFPADTSMPDPETNSGNFCYDCYLNLEYQWDNKRGIAWLKEHLPSLENFMKAYKTYAKGSLDPRKMENNCHAAATALVKLLKDKMDITVERGHWVAPDVRRAKIPFQQHSWTSVRVPNNSIVFIVDPTQWVFTGKEPELCISNEDDRRYDIGGYNIKAAILGEKVIPERNGTTVKSNLPKAAKEWLNSKAPRDWSIWTVEEIFVIANIDPRKMNGNAKSIFKAIIDCGHEGFIPLEGFDLAGV